MSPFGRERLRRRVGPAEVAEHVLVGVPVRAGVGAADDRNADAVLGTAADPGSPPPDSWSMTATLSADELAARAARLPVGLLASSSTIPFSLWSVHAPSEFWYAIRAMKSCGTSPKSGASAPVSSVIRPILITLAFAALALP